MALSRRARLGRYCFILCACATAICAAVAQDAVAEESASQPASRVVTAQRAFVIPFELDAPQEASLAPVEVRLFVSRDHGANWELADRANPKALRFNFRAPSDGEYWFSLQTVDRQGRSHPAGETRAGLIVVVDPSHAPAQPNRSPASAPRAPTESLPRAQAWPADAKTDVPVERARDESPTPAPAPIHSPVSRRVVPEDSQPIKRAAELRDLPRGERPRFVATRRLRLACQIEDVKSHDLQHVELWQTAEAGATWRCVAKLQSANVASDTPFQNEVECDGLFGFRLASSTKHGKGERPPRPGETADVWVYVDTSPPQVQITRAIIHAPPSADRAPRLEVQWRAQDAALAPRGISLAYSDKPEGPWTTIAAGLMNHERYEWTLEGRLPQRLYIQIEARDEAANVGRHRIAEPIIVPAR
jgi:hypothetical protein